MMNEKIYLCGPMTGLPHFNYPAFCSATKTLRGAGFEVVNPAEIAVPGESWVETMDRCIKALKECGRVVLLEGWEMSKGAMIERDLAMREGIAIEKEFYF